MNPRMVFKILTVAAAAAAGALAGEIAVRLLGLAPPLPEQYRNCTTTPYLAYGPRPSSRVAGRSARGEFTYDYRHNAFGFRDEEHELAKPRGVFRVLGLGDSFTYGVGAAFEETYLYRLERMLNARLGEHPRVEIIKCGVPRFFPEPERILLEKLGLQFEPDLVIVGFVPNDVIDTFYGLDAVKVDPSGYLITRQAVSPGSVGRFVYRRSHLCRLVLSKYMAWRNDRVEDWAAVYAAGGTHEADWRRIEEEFAKMAFLARSIGARMLVVHIPRKGPWSEASEYPARRLASWAEANGAGFVDTLPAMRDAMSASPLYYARDGHCTPAGYAVVAKEVARYLEENRWVP